MLHHLNNLENIQSTNDLTPSAGTSIAAISYSIVIWIFKPRPIKKYSDNPVDNIRIIFHCFLRHFRDLASVHQTKHEEHLSPWRFQN